MFTRGNNDIANGIVKVSSYLEVRDYHQHPITNESGAPYFYYTAYRDWETDRKSTRLNSSHSAKSRMPSSA